MGKLWNVLFVIWAVSFSLFLGFTGYYFYNIKEEEKLVKSMAVYHTEQEGILYEEGKIEHPFILEGDINGDVVYYAASYYYSIPEKVRSEFNKDGWKVVLTDKDISKEYYSGDVKGRLAGLASSEEKKLYIHAEKKDVRRAMIHEFGHYWDYKCGVGSMDSEFEGIYLVEKELFHEKWKVDDHATSNSQEFFAEAFVQLILYPDTLADECPKTYHYVNNLVSETDPKLSKIIEGREM